MSYNLAYSVLTPITNGETSLQLTLNDPRIIDWLSASAAPACRGQPLRPPISGYEGFYFCAVLLIVASSSLSKSSVRLSA